SFPLLQGPHPTPPPPPPNPPTPKKLEPAVNSKAVTCPIVTVLVRLLFPALTLEAEEMDLLGDGERRPVTESRRRQRRVPALNFGAPPPLLFRKLSNPDLSPAATAATKSKLHRQLSQDESWARRSSLAMTVYKHTAVHCFLRFLHCHLRLCRLPSVFASLFLLPFSQF
ncbi:hypothetical protein FQN60_012706, partial [Etheostoma spectabile]